MKYTEKQFGLDLLEELDRGYNAIRLARWSYSKFISECKNLEEGLRAKIMQVVVMEEGPEFEMKEEELRSFATNLVQNKRDENKRDGHL